MHTIKEVSNMLNISKESIYKKVQSSLQNELQSHVFKSNKGTLIDDSGVEIIKKSLKSFNPMDEKDEETEECLDEDSDASGSVYYSQIQSAEIIAFLKNQIEEKDKQIVILLESKDELLQSKNKEIETKNEQMKLLLETNNNLISTFQNEQKLQAFKAIEQNKTHDVEDAVAEKEEVVKETKKGFFEKIFRK